MARLRGIHAYRVTSPPPRARRTGLMWHAVPATALSIVDDRADPAGLIHRLAAYRVTLVPSRMIDLTELRPTAIAV